MEEVNFILSIGDCCVPAELCKANKASVDRLGYGFIFDWAGSDIKIACDIVENGLDWHIINNIKSMKLSKKNTRETKYYEPYKSPSQTPFRVDRYNKFYCPHHAGTEVIDGVEVPRGVEYMTKCAERFFKVLNNTVGYNVIFLYMSARNLPIGDLQRFIEIVRRNYSGLKFKVVAANSIYKDVPIGIKHTSISESLDIYNCKSPGVFYSNTMNNDQFYFDLFNTIIPYKLNIINIDDVG